MEKINASGMNSAQLTLLERMQQTAMVASGGAVKSGQFIPPAESHFTTPASFSFSQILNNAIDNVNTLQRSASTRQNAIDMGKSDDLVGAMIESQKASVAFLAMVQVRNKLTVAMDEVMNIPL